MATTRAGSARVGPFHIVALVVLWAGAATAHALYGNRHNFFDLGIYHRAVQWWADGHPIYSYSQPDRVEGSLGFTYPPFAAVLLRPLAGLNLIGAQVAFGIVSAVALVVALWYVAGPVARRLGYPAWFGVALALPLVSWLEPVRETFTFGQVNFILLALIVVDLLVAVPRRSRWAGIGIGLAAAIKLTPAIFVLYLLLTRRWRPAVTAMLTAAAATLVGGLAMWHDSLRFWTDLLWRTERIGHIERITNQSVMGMLARLSEPAAPNRVVWVLLVVTILGYGLWRARAAAAAGDELAGVTLTALVGCLVSPVTWTHHLVWFVPALALLVDVALGRGRPPRQRWWLAALALVLWATVVCSVTSWYEWKFLDPESVQGTPAGFLIENWYVLLTVVLLMALPIRRRSSDAGQAEPSPKQREVVASERY
jgi:alpha-1,2-mannosyltransferase